MKPFVLKLCIELYFLIRSSRIFSLFEKKNLASNEIIKRSANIKNRILTISIPAKESPIKPINPVNAVSTKNNIVCFLIFLVLFQS